MLCRPNFEVLHNDYNRIVDHIMIYNNLKKKAENGCFGRWTTAEASRPVHHVPSLLCFCFFFLHGNMPISLVDVIDPHAPSNRVTLTLSTSPNTLIRSIFRGFFCKFTYHLAKKKKKHSLATDFNRFDQL